MGYRSDVRLITSRKGYESLKKFTEKYLKEKKWTYGNLMDSCDLFFKNDKVAYFGWNNIKWYDGYPEYEDINAIEDGLKYLESKDFSYRMGKIGEEYADIEVDCHDGKDEDLDYLIIDRSFDDDYLLTYFKGNENELTNLENPNELII